MPLYIAGRIRSTALQRLNMLDYISGARPGSFARGMRLFEFVFGSDATLDSAALCRERIRTAPLDHDTANFVFLEQFGTEVAGGICRSERPAAQQAVTARLGHSEGWLHAAPGGTIFSAG